MATTADEAAPEDEQAAKPGLDAYAEIRAWLLGELADLDLGAPIKLRN